MKKLLLIGALLALSAPALAQTTRSTPCNPATPNNALCVQWTPPTTYTDGTTIPSSVTLRFRVEQRVGLTGAWATAQNNITGVNTAYFQNLAPGTYYYRVYVNCSLSTCIESDASNIANKDATANPTIPNAPVITIAVVISPDPNVAPVYRILDGNQRSPEIAGLVPLGRACTGPVVFRFRDLSFRQVKLAYNETWGMTPASYSKAKFAAACAKATA